MSLTGKTLTASPTSQKISGLPRTESPEGIQFTACDRAKNFDAIIPHDHDHRTLVLCFDGTGDQFDDDNSNIVNLFTALKKDAPSKQLVYYQSGIGTYTIPQVATPFAAKLKKLISSMVANDLDGHVMAGYEFLMQNYECGDKICLFGFSRGAYTARALAGMVHKVGLLPRFNHNQVPFAYKMYSTQTNKGWTRATAFKKSFCIDVDIEFLGVWDTVGSVGILPRRLPFTTSNTHVRIFRHALALDEHRVRFSPSFWIRPKENETARGVQRGAMPRSSHLQKPKRLLSLGGEIGKSKEDLKELERKFSQMTDFETNVEEVWFAGCHADVGGGSVPNATRNSLARIPLRWMIRECFKMETGIMFHSELLYGLGIDPETLHPSVADISPSSSNIPSSAPLSSFVQMTPSRRDRLSKHSGTDHQIYNASDFVSEFHETHADARSPLYDQLKEAKYWWLLEMIPQKIRYQRHDDTLARKYAINMGKCRVIPHQQTNGIKVHRSVKLRMESEVEGSKGEKYIPQAMWQVEPTWVD
ncbi:hypothetical protein DL96DRAFT_1817098 [Flagelloscypha sp. PMI_526]|nr:hypothetical protein DL96DRAFT_1817098 [Flagelloscypha sp. PMI_526]